MARTAPRKAEPEIAEAALARPLLIDALEYVQEKDDALDLGAGALNDTKYLLSLGFKRVTAVDMDPASAEKASEISLGGFTFVQSAYADFKFPKARYDVVNAQYALPFNPPGTFNEVLRKVIASLKPNGVFVGQFFGKRDSMNVKDSGKTFHTIDEAKKLLSDLHLKDFREEEEGGRHVFHFIAIK